MQFPKKEGLKMERTESVVVQVAPDYENEKIKEMEMFGWNLQSRQEMHVEGDAEGRPSITGSSYVVKTKVSHYVKLHFVRDLTLPDLSQIKSIESEYFGLPFPMPPAIKSFLWPALFILAGIISLTNPERGAGIGGFVVLAGLGGWWFFSKIKKRQKNLRHLYGQRQETGRTVNQVEDSGINGSCLALQYEISHRQ